MVVCIDSCTLEENGIGASVRDRDTHELPPRRVVVDALGPIETSYQQNEIKHESECGCDVLECLQTAFSIASGSLLFFI